jgi:hypothetical protein
MSGNQLSRARATLTTLAGALTFTMISIGCDRTGTHIARNESGAPAENIVIYLAPQAAALRIDVTPAPGNCPF